MGMGYQTREQQLKNEEVARIILEKRNAALARIAGKISMVVIDHINRIVVRPGPVAEERECYDMAQEIRDTDEQLTLLITDILTVAKNERELRSGS